MIEAGAMKELPILFRGDMVCAILDDAKPQTRRVMKPQPYSARTATGGPTIMWQASKYHHCGGTSLDASKKHWLKHCPYGQPGTRLWVKETWRPECEEDTGARLIQYRADGHSEEGFDCSVHYRVMDGTDRWRSPLYMPRWASRLDLAVTDVRVERLQEITEEDAKAEGVRKSVGGMWTAAEGQCGTTPRAAFALLWDSINGKTYPWDSDPYVWVVAFKRIEVTV